ncbi:ABC transporter permease [Buchananella hordeovulneris]|uniref:Peptide ABC transporter permease n=1 Tax=Buchananella hordeovulneris TaxID=52770 RepID=A0A1Q5PUX7_9ACTO|nr:ABC transporter permease [Buchananella hordeovulneris]OKL51368.1 peptide ABC transporter permease [Buchananella hordeovulneris]
MNPARLLTSLRPLLGALAVLLIVTFATFAVFTLWPADPALLACGRPCTPQRLATARTFLGYDQPWYTQAWQYLVGIFAGRTFGEGAGAIHCSAPCLGYSVRLGAPVTDLVLARLPATFSLALGAMVLWLLIGVGVGVLSARRRGTLLDRVLLGGTVLGVSTPSYLLGLLALAILGFGLGVIPVAGYVPFSTDPVGWFQHLITPWVILALLNAAIYARLVRSTVLEQDRTDHVRTARALGLSERTILTHFTLPGVAVPVITLTALDLGALLGGAVITEKVFSLNGIGSLLIEAVDVTDLPIIVALTLLAAAFVLLANALADTLAHAIDPRRLYR